MVRVRRVRVHFLLQCLLSTATGSNGHSANPRVPGDQQSNTDDKGCVIDVTLESVLEAQ